LLGDFYTITIIFDEIDHIIEIEVGGHRTFLLAHFFHKNGLHDRGVGGKEINIIVYLPTASGKVEETLVIFSFRSIMLDIILCHNNNNNNNTCTASVCFYCVKYGPI